MHVTCVLYALSVMFVSLVGCLCFFVCFFFSRIVPFCFVCLFASIAQFFGPPPSLLILLHATVVSGVVRVHVRLHTRFALLAVVVVMVLRFFFFAQFCFIRSLLFTRAVHAFVHSFIRMHSFILMHCIFLVLSHTQTKGFCKFLCVVHLLGFC